MRFLFSSCLLLFYSALYAQPIADSLTTLEVGLGAGTWTNQVGFSYNVLLEGTTVADLNSANFGLALRYFNNKTFGFQAEIGYDQGGWQEIQDSMDLYYRRSIDFLTIQMFTQVAVGQGRFRPLIQGGPFVSFPLADQEFIPQTFTIPSLERSYYQTPYPFRITYGLIFGGGFYYQLGKLSIQLEGRFLAGFSDLYRSGQTQAETSRRRSFGGRLTAWYRLR
ncbi:MAG: porin family protein [Bacteroidota bacterium]